ncbi:DUF4168 domain-containing protein [Lacimicrobium sp. SS2-24]|uniref:DUF4168 domain-containing protein n=1 Tax=Lacimicrobium sp. SS2-24 TaxID=2005569 RepID=UPI000B4B684D|nr:DUF4168 domain-containing protein [Lacimicrobium sp. SS2-24]
MRKLILAISTSMALLGLSISAIAQDAAPVQQSVQTQQAVSDAKLQQVVGAMNEVRAISNKYAEAFQNAQDKTQAQQIQQKAQQEMIEAVSQSGLSAQEYNTIVKRLQTDEQLRERLNTMAAE